MTNLEARAERVAGITKTVIEAQFSGT